MDSDRPHRFPPPPVSSEAQSASMPPRCIASLLSVADALMPSMHPPPDGNDIVGAKCVREGSTDRDRGEEKNNSRDAEAMRRYYAHSLRTDPHYADALRIAVMTRLGAEERRKLLLLLYLLSTVLGTLLLLSFHPYALYLCFVDATGKEGNVGGGCGDGEGGRNSSPRRQQRRRRYRLRLRTFVEWAADERAWALIQWRDGTLKQKREIFAGLKRLSCGIALSYIVREQSNDNSGGGGASQPPYRLNPYWEAMGYRGPIHEYLDKDEDRRLIEESGQHDFSKKNSGGILDATALAESAEPKDRGHTFDGKNFEEGRKRIIELEYDVVIVGSGAGGGVAASVLSDAGYTVLVLEKGPYVPPVERTNLESDMLDRQYEGHALLTSSDGVFTILAGSSLGGGTSINWACCLEPPRHVLMEWFEDCHCRERFARSMEAIKERIGASTTGVTHNVMNAKFVSGCEAAKFHVERTGQNLADTQPDAAGYTCFGDRYGNKRGGTVTFLADACRTGKTNILPNCTADRIVVERETVTRHLDEGAATRTKRFAITRATGVEARCFVQADAGGGGVASELRLWIKARKCVISSCGALNTPCLLLRSNFRNRHIGRHIKLHPVVATLGYYGPSGKGGGNEKEQREANVAAGVRSPMEGSVAGYLGAPMTSVSNEFQHGPDNSGYGAKLECPSVHTGIVGASTPWMSAKDFRGKLLLWKDSVNIIVLQRDRGEGRVTLGGGKDGRSPKVAYELDERDRKSMVEALVGAVKILIASGCTFVSTGHYDRGLTIDDVPGPSNSPDAATRLDRPEVKAYLDRLQKLSWEPFRVGLFTAHQMGSCRMGSRPSESACDIDGELWECDDLYVFDTSLFPTASGSNPMLSVLALSHMLSSKLALRLKYEDSRLCSKEEDAAKAIEAEDMMRVREERRVLGMVHGPLPQMPEWLEVALHISFWCLAALVITAGAWDVLKEFVEEEL